MGVTITEEFRTEFEQVGPDGVRKHKCGSLQQRKAKSRLRMAGRKGARPGQVYCAIGHRRGLGCRASGPDRKYQGDYRVGNRQHLGSSSNSGYHRASLSGSKY